MAGNTIKHFKAEMGAKSLSHQQLWMLARIGNAEMEFRSQPCFKVYGEGCGIFVLYLTIQTK
jgi:hypothetical protein